MFIKRILLPIIALAFAAPAPALDVNDPPVGRFSDEWYAIMIQGNKSGHAHSIIERVRRAGGDVIRTKLELNLAMRRADAQVSVDVVEESEETLDGKPLGFTNRLKMGPMPGPTVTGRIRDGKVYITTMQFGQQSDRNVVDLPDGAMMSWAVYREQMKRGLEPGTSYTLNTYQPGTQPTSLIPTKVEVLERETIDLFGRKTEVARVRQTLNIRNMLGQNTDVTTMNWITPEGEVLRSTMSMMNLQIELKACSRSVALSENDPAEIMLDLLIRADRPVPDDAKKVRYTITLKKKADAKKLPSIPDTNLQTADARSPRKVDITVDVAAARNKPGKPLTDDERKRYLAATSVLNHKDPEVARLADKAAGDEKDPARLAAKLTRFVEPYVQTKNLSIGFATAGEVARSREGDCTEHGVLLAALARAKGIPSRIVTGIVYVDEFAGRKGVFVGHLWTQLYIDGRWIDFDATRGKPVETPTHIAVSLSDGGEGNVADLVNSLWLNLGSLEITVHPEG